MANLKKNKQGYGYQYTDLAEIHNYLEENDMSYVQYIDTVDGVDYIMTQKYKKGEKDGEPLRGCRIVQATLSGKSNPAQEQGSALTYARRYSVLMAYGLATTDDDAAALDVPISAKNTQAKTQAKPTEIRPAGKITVEEEQELRQFITDNNVQNAKVITELMKIQKTRLNELDSKQLTGFKENLLKDIGEK